MKHIHGVGLPLLLGMLLFSCGSPYSKWEGKWVNAEDPASSFEIRVMGDMPVLILKRGQACPIRTSKKPMEVVVSGSGTMDFIYDPGNDVVYLHGMKYKRAGL